MKLSKNLSLAEFTRSQTAKRRGIDNTPMDNHLEAAKKLAENIFQPIREHFGKPIFISSGYRSDALNKAIGGSSSSQHSKAEAIDVDMDGHSKPTNTEVFYYIKDNLDFDQLIWEFGDDEKPDWVHVSYKAMGEQRNQILQAKRNSAGKTYYELWTKP
jgi:zinc D-Ala-D-Ala carboxypeptidase